MEADSRDLQVRVRSLIESLTVAKLKSVLRAYKCSVTGRKADLQERMLMLVRNTGPSQLLAMEQVIRRTDFDDYGTPAAPAPPPTYTDIANSIWGPTMPQGRGYPLSGSVGPSPVRIAPPHAPSVPPVKLNFNLAPFFKVMNSVSEPAYFAGPQREHKKGIELRVRLSEAIISQLKSGSLVLAFLSCDVTVATPQQVLYYPFNCSIWINGINVPTVPKTRGIKGIPGTATPLDLTKAYLDSARGAHPVPNPLVKFTFSVSQDAAKDDRTMYKSFATGAYLLQPSSVADLIKEVTSRPHIPVSEAIRIIKGDEDCDIIATQAVHSLKDPIIRTRMRVPIRSRTCDHLDCVDAEAFVMFLRQSPRWKCAHCNSDITWDSMAVDDLMTDILNNTKESADKVSINDDGTWTLLSSDSDSEDSSDDDSSNEPPAKRIRPKQPEVIDLLSDSDDDNDNDDDDDDEDLPVPPLPPPVQPPQSAETPSSGPITRVTQVSDHDSTSEDDFDQPIEIPPHLDLSQASETRIPSGNSIIAQLGGSLFSTPVERNLSGPTKGTFSTPPIASPRSHNGTPRSPAAAPTTPAAPAAPAASAAPVDSSSPAGPAAPAAPVALVDPIAPATATPAKPNSVRRNSAQLPSPESIQSLLKTGSLLAKPKNSLDPEQTSPPKVHREGSTQHQHNRPWEARSESQHTDTRREVSQQRPSGPPPPPQLHYQGAQPAPPHAGHQHAGHQHYSGPSHPHQGSFPFTFSAPKSVWTTFSANSGAPPTVEVVDLTEDD